MFRARRFCNIALIVSACLLPTVKPQFVQQGWKLVGAGLYQFNVVVPNIPNGDNSVVIDIGSTSTQPNVFLNVQR